MRAISFGSGPQRRLDTLFVVIVERQAEDVVAVAFAEVLDRVLVAVVADAERVFAPTDPIGPVLLKVSDFQRAVDALRAGQGVVLDVGEHLLEERTAVRLQELGSLLDGLAADEFLEQPGFEYGQCDGCRSKYELVTGAKPGLLPNKQQRAEMDKVGKARSVD